jgi:transcriptional regulator with XRE-family HTH domain
VSFAAVVQIEAGRRADPRISTVAALAEALEVDVDYLVGQANCFRSLLEHCAFYYDNDDDFLATTVPFITQGLEAQDAVVAVTSKRNLNRLRTALGPVAADQVEMIDSAKWYTTPVDAMSRCAELVNDRIGEGRSWVRVVAEPIWGGRQPAHIDAWVRYETLLNLAFASAPATVVCPYDQRHVSGPVVANARNTHPNLLGVEGITGNEDCIDAATLLLKNSKARLPQPRAPRQ